jgi:hypothetical protein
MAPAESDARGMKDQASLTGFKRSQLRAQRVRVKMPASVTTLSAYRFPELADISLTGAKVKGAIPPAKGALALLRAGPLEVLCRVVWTREDECGLRFDEAVSSAMLKHIQLTGAVELQTPRPRGPDKSA